jgi:hypothetical protein
LRITLDASEPLDDVLRVLGALYKVTLVVSAEQGLQSSENPAEATVPTESTTPQAPGKRRAPRKTRRGSEPIESPAVVTSSAKAPSNALVRAWARENGLTVSDRGRVPAAVRSAYREAHGE